MHHVQQPECVTHSGVTHCECDTKIYKKYVQKALIKYQSSGYLTSPGKENRQEILALKLSISINYKLFLFFFFALITIINKGLHKLRYS